MQPIPQLPRVTVQLVLRLLLLPLLLLLLLLPLLLLLVVPPQLLRAVRLFVMQLVQP